LSQKGQEEYYQRNEEWKAHVRKHREETGDDIVEPISDIFLVVVHSSWFTSLVYLNQFGNTQVPNCWKALILCHVEKS